MKITTTCLIILIALFALSCGNDEGQGRVELALSTEDGIENFNSILPPCPTYATTPTWLNELRVLAYAGDPATGTLLMDDTYPASSLVSGEYLPAEVPAGRNITLVVHALDRNKVIQYAGSAGPVDVQANAVVALTVVMQKMVSTPTKNLELTLNLKYLNDGHQLNIELIRCGITDKLYANIYTRAVKIGDQWVPTNPDDGVDYSVGGSYNNDNSQWSGKFLDNAFQFITVRAEDDSGGVVLYGVQAYDARWGYEYNNSNKPLPIYMRHPSKLVVTLQGSSLPSNAKVQMYVNDDWRDLYVSGTFDSIFNATSTNPVVVDAPSGEGWFTGAPVQTRKIQVYQVGAQTNPWGTEVSIPVDFGVSSVTITAP